MGRPRWGVGALRCFSVLSYEGVGLHLVGKAPHLIFTGFDPDAKRFPVEAELACVDG